MAYYAGLYLYYFRLRLKQWSQYRADFIISTVSSLLLDGSTLLFLSVIFSKIRQLEGWTFPEMVLIWALSMITRFLANGVLDAPHRFYWYIRFGDMDRVLVRPAGMLFQIAGEDGINLPFIGRALVGVIALFTVLPSLRLPWWSAVYLPLTVVSGVLIMFSVQVTIASLSFWFVNANSVLTTMSWLAQFGQYPVTIFDWPLRILFTWILPYAMVSFYPAAFMLHSAEYLPYGLLAPLVGAASFLISMAVWSEAVKHYQSTGS